MLVVVQVALALVLLICSGLMIRTFRALMALLAGICGAGVSTDLRYVLPETRNIAIRTQAAGADGTGHSGKTGGDCGSFVK